jgi:hypothetical protein
MELVGRLYSDYESVNISSILCEPTALRAGYLSLVVESPVYLYPVITQAVSLIRIRFTRLKPAALALAIASCQVS